MKNSGVHLKLLAACAVGLFSLNIVGSGEVLATDQVIKNDKMMLTGKSCPKEFTNLVKTETGYIVQATKPEKRNWQMKWDTPTDEKTWRGIPSLEKVPTLKRLFTPTKKAEINKVSGDPEFLNLECRYTDRYAGTEYSFILWRTPTQKTKDRYLAKIEAGRKKFMEQNNGNDHNYVNSTLYFGIFDEIANDSD